MCLVLQFAIFPSNARPDPPQCMVYYYPVFLTQASSTLAFLLALSETSSAILRLPFVAGVPFG